MRSASLLCILAKATAAERPKHILALLVDDYGWANAGWHVPDDAEVQTPTMNRLVSEGIELERHYAFALCSPSRSATQSGRNPIHVNTENLDPIWYNSMDNVSGFAGIPRGMTGMAEVLRGAGYATHYYGKWDCGMATPEHAPKGRGYEKALFYFHHMNNHWMSTYEKGNGDTNAFPKCKAIMADYRPPDLWLTNASYDGPAIGLNNTAECNPGDFDVCSKESSCPPHPGFPGKEPDGCRYEDQVFLEELLDDISVHDVSKPFFAFWAPHVAHSPLMVPKSHYDLFANVTDWRRRRYLAMVSWLDDAVELVIQKLKTKDMYDDLLMVMSSDNGGPIYQRGGAGASNYPLRGGKQGNFEGGIRVNGFVSGGLLPQDMRGVKLAGLSTLWDWYATFADVAGVKDITDHKASKHKLPPVDSISQWPYWSGGTQQPARTSFAIGEQGGGAVQGYVLDKGTDGLWKLLTGGVHQDARMGPSFPNRSTGLFHDFNCGTGCLFRLDTDPEERHDLFANQPKLAAELEALRSQAADTLFKPNRGKSDPQSCVAALTLHRGFWGPFVFPKDDLSMDRAIAV